MITGHKNIRSAVTLKYGAETVRAVRSLLVLTTLAPKGQTYTIDEAIAYLSREGHWQGFLKMLNGLDFFDDTSSTVTFTEEMVREMAGMKMGQIG